MQVGISFHISKVEQDQIKALAERHEIAATAWIKRQIKIGLENDADYLIEQGLMETPQEALAG